MVGGGARVASQDDIEYIFYQNRVYVDFLSFEEDKYICWIEAQSIIN